MKRLWVVPLLILLISVSIVYAQRTAGVQTGDWAEYAVEAIIEGGVGDSQSPFENVTSIRVDVVEVVGTNVSLNGQVILENGSSTVTTMWVDVDTGVVGPSGGFPVIAADLMEGDRIYTSSQGMFGDMTINETVTREYLGSSVETNHLMVDATSPPNPQVNQSVVFDCYWYRDTGFPAEIHMYIMVETPEITMLTDIDIVVIGVIPELPLTSMALAAVSLTAMAVVLLKRRLSSSVAHNHTSD